MHCNNFDRGVTAVSFALEPAKDKSETDIVIDSQGTINAIASITFSSFLKVLNWQLII